MKKRRAPRKPSRPRPKAKSALMPGVYLQTLGEPVRKVEEVAAPLAETSWQKFLKFFY